MKICFERKNCFLFLLFTAFMFFGVFCVLSRSFHTYENYQKNPVDVLLIGDSITYGWNYCPEKLLKAFGGKVIVQGVGGIDTLGLHALLSSTKEFKSRLSMPWYNLGGIEKTPLGRVHFDLKSYDPRVVVLEVGINNWLLAAWGQDDEQINEYKVSRNYTDLDITEIQDDAVTGSVNARGVYQIVMQIKDMYGAETPIILVGAFPSHFVPDPAHFNALLKEFSKNKENPASYNVTYLDSAPISRIGWSEEYKMFYDHRAFPAEKDQFDSVHADAVHLNEKGYDIYLRMLECPVKRALGEHKSVCSPVSAGDVNSGLNK